MQSDLQSLHDLQEKDRRVMSVEDELRGLEPELEELDRVLGKLEDELAAARKRAGETVSRREGLEGKIESYRVMQERRRQKLEWVRGAKEASTLMAEIDLARSVLAKEEAEWIRSADEVQRVEQMTDELVAQLEELRTSQAPRRSEIAELQSQCRERLDQATAERQQFAKGVKRPLLLQYERIRKGRAPLALYPLHGGACGHCYTAVPLHLRQQMEQTASAATCEACGVMIYLAG